MLIVSNWKAYVDTEKRAEELIRVAKRITKKRSFQNTLFVPVLAPPFPLLGVYRKRISPLSCASQDVSNIAPGSGTGEVTARLLRALGVSYVIIGHSERRKNGETDSLVREKTQRALEENLIPIVCIGENFRDEHGQYLSELRTQIRAIFEDLDVRLAKKIIIAYEPVWAIGKGAGGAMQPDDLEEMVLYIRKCISEHIPERSALQLPILYGGSVLAENAFLLVKQGRVQGLLIGRSGVESDAYQELVKALSKTS